MLGGECLPGSGILPGRSEWSRRDHFHHAGFIAHFDFNGFALKLIVALLLANLALAGALRFLRPAESVVAQPEAPLATGPEAAVNMSLEHEIAPTVEISVVETELSDPAGEWRNWVARDPHAAAEWAAQQPAGENRDAVLETACYEIGNVNPAKAVALAESFPSRTKRRSAI